MTDLTRRSLLVTAGVTVATAGCLTDSDGEAPTTESRERTTTDSRGPTTTDSSGPTTTDSADGTTGDWIERASNEPNPDHSVTLHNRATESKTVRVRVERGETGETVFETTETVDPDVELELYNLKEADPDGVEPVEICGELVDSSASTADESTADAEVGTTTASSTTGQTATTDETTIASERRDCATIRTNQCYANAHVTVREDGSVQVIYAIC